MNGRTSALASWIPAMARRRILVIGEAMLDSYLHGTARRLSQEAPVPIVALSERFDVPGGAANAAANVAALGGLPVLLSVIGDDAEGRRLRDAATECGVRSDELIEAEGRA